MQVTFWGVRGSIPVPGPQTARWGGNSSCLQVTREDAPTLVLDCGTGARALGEALVRERCRDVHVLFSHLHTDHIFGLPFFLPMYTPGVQVRIGVPAYTAEEAKQKIGRYLSGVYHPVRLRDVPSALGFHAVSPSKPVDVPGWQVRAARLAHPGGACGYRIGGDTGALAYVTDTAPFAQPGEGVAAGEPPTVAERRMIAFLRGCHTVVFDTMFDYDTYLEKMTWGHAYPDYAYALCAAAGVSRLVLFHHAPDASDDDLDARAEAYASHVAPTVVLAREGATITVPSGASPT